MISCDCWCLQEFRGHIKHRLMPLGRFGLAPFPVFGFGIFGSAFLEAFWRLCGVLTWLKLVFHQYFTLFFHFSSSLAGIIRQSCTEILIRTASWLITFLASHPEWARKARAEVEDLVATHTNVRFPSSQITPLSPVSWPSSSPTPTTTPPLPSISDALNQIPLSSWEDPSCTRILDALIKETLRVAQPHTAMRRNVGPEFYIDGKRIETGDYVVYPFSDVHLDEEIYENAAAWIPERWLNPSDDEKDTFVMPGRGTPFGYVGWGGGMFRFLIRDCAWHAWLCNCTGKNTCLGTRLAKAELKLIVSMFVLGFDSSIADKKGDGWGEMALPQPNWNDILLCRPEKKFWMGFERRKGVQLWCDVWWWYGLFIFDLFILMEHIGPSRTPSWVCYMGWWLF